MLHQSNNENEIAKNQLGITKNTAIELKKKEWIDTGRRKNGKTINLIGKRYGKLLITKYLSTRKKISWEAICDCGNTTVSTTAQLIYLNKRSCGCLTKEYNHRKLSDIIGKVFTWLKPQRFVSGKDKKGKWECLCKCGNIVFVRTSHLRIGHIKSCGCYQKYFVKNRKGPKNGRWRKDLTKEDRLINKSRWYDPRTLAWKTRVFKRDKYTCQISGDNKGGNLCAHHISSWSKSKSLRFVTKNGVTLTKEIHKLFHQLYGNRNTKKQLIEFETQYHKGEFDNILTFKRKIIS